MVPSARVRSLDMAQDYVDSVLSQWEGERPDLDTSALGIISRVLRLAAYLKDYDARILNAFDLAPWGFEVLAALRRQGAPYELSPTALRQAALLSSGAMTNRIDRLAASGWVERRPAVHDRRGVMVRLTAAGKTLIDRAIEARLAHARELVSSLSESERASLAALLKRLLLAHAPQPIGRAER